MKEKHIVLRTIKSIVEEMNLDPYGGSFKANEYILSGHPHFQIPAELKVEVNELSRNKISELPHKEDILAVAPAIPMKLIAPVKIEGISPAADNVAWGISAVGADNTPYTGDGIVVAVLDTGIDKAHPAFNGINIIEKDFTGEGNGDVVGHGTHCAGTIFGRPVNGVRIGVAPGVKKALIGKVLGNNVGSSDIIAEAIQWAVNNGANVISMSLGMDFPGYVDYWVNNGLPPALATSRALEGYRTNVQLFEKLAAFVKSLGGFNHPCIIVAAAGNESKKDENPNFEIAVAPPAVSDGIVSVAALEQSNGSLKVASFSNTGANIAAPGVQIISAGAGGGLIKMTGTSMATPHVAGVAALWAEKIMKTGVLNPQLLTNKIFGSAVYDCMAPGYDPFDIGAGLVRAPQ